MQWTFESVRAMQVWLGAVKSRRRCVETKPIGQFYLPSVTEFRGYKNCVDCCLAMKRQRRQRARRAA